MCIFMLLCVFKKKKKKRSGRIYTELLTVIISEKYWRVGMKEEKNRRNKEKNIYFPESLFLYISNVLLCFIDFFLERKRER